MFLFAHFAVNYFQQCIPGNNWYLEITFLIFKITIPYTGRDLFHRSAKVSNSMESMFGRN
jgi:hypothetical protein